MDKDMDMDRIIHLHGKPAGAEGRSRSRTALAWMLAWNNNL